MADLFPFSINSRRSILGAYQRQARRRPVIWILVVVMLVYVGMLIKDSWEGSNPRTVTWSALGTADVELSAAIHASDWPGWVRWFGGVESEDEALEWMAEEFEKLAEKGLLEGDAVEAAKILSDLENGKLEPQSEDYWQKKYREGVWPWERIAAARQYGDEPPDWLVHQEVRYERFNERKAIQMASGNLVWWFVLILGLPFVPAALRCFRVKNHQPVSPVIRAWEPSMVTVRYVLTDLLVGFLIVYFWMLIPDVLWDNYFGPTLIITDAVWRIGGPLLFGLYLFVRWRHAWRLLGLHLAPVVKPVLGMVSLGIIYDYVLWYSIGQFTLSESLEGLSYEEEGLWGSLLPSFPE